MSIKQARIYSGPAPASGPEYATVPDLVQFATAHECERAARRDLEGLEAAASNQPHQQATRYKKYGQALRGSLQRIRVVAATAVEDADIFGLTDDGPNPEALVEAPAPYDYERDPKKEAAFRDWLDSQLEREILEEYGGENQYIETAYIRAIQDADAELREAGIADPDADVAAVVRQGVHERSLSALFERNYRALEGMTEELGSDLSRELLDGFSAGEGPYDVSRRIRDTVGKAGDTGNMGYMARSDVIARTEIMRAQHVGTTERYEQFGVSKVRIVLTPDACELCHDLKAQGPFDMADAGDLLPRHPNCRCTISIAT